jgi:hypothetical protein
MEHETGPGKYGRLARKIRGGESASAQQARIEDPEIVITRRENRAGWLGGVPVVKIFINLANSTDLVVVVDGQEMARKKWLDFK